MLVARLRLSVLVLVLGAALVWLALPSTDAQAKRRSCPGTVTFAKKTTKVVTYRGVSCAEAKRILRGYDRGLPEPPWRCALAHAPFDRIDGRNVGLSCGYGTGPSNLRKKSHAFVGTIARR